MAAGSPLPIWGQAPGRNFFVAAAALTTQYEQWERERRFARIHRCLPADLAGLVPADVGALRSGLL